MYRSDDEFYRDAERLASAFSARYGAEDGWTDEQLDRALADYGLPALADLPSGPRGTMKLMNPGPVQPGEHQQWRRVNASHLLGHVIMHGGLRCPGCVRWGTTAE